MAHTDTPRFYLIIRGEVETGPGHFEPGVISSTGHPTWEAAWGDWEEMVDEGIYEYPYETYEIRGEAPSLAEVL
jgi:hypothetical protein